MTSQDRDWIVDGDGHVMEDFAAIVRHMPEAYWGGFHQGIKNPFPPLDHLHSANQLGLPTGAFAPVGMEGWLDFMNDVGIGRTVLYTTMGLSFGKIVSRDWAIELAHAYNDWIAENYVHANPRFQAMAPIPLQDTTEAVLELRRAVEERGRCGAMLPSTGADQAMSHLGDERYWPIYEEADRLGCALGIHGGAHGGLGMDGLSPYAPVHALGHPFGIMVSFAGIVFNGVLDRYPRVRFGFVEAGAGWLMAAMERFTGSWASHVQYDPRGRFLQLRPKETIADYIMRHIDEDRIYVGVEGDELTLPSTIRMVGNKPFVYSSDFPHEVNNETCAENIRELRENTELSADDKEAMLYRNGKRLYGLA